MITILLILFFTNSATSASTSGWCSSSCRSARKVKNQPLEPNECYTIVKGNIANPLMSIEASGLQDTNAEGGDYIELYTEGDCKEWKSRVKWSAQCQGIVYRSVKYIPPSRVNGTMKVERQLTEEEVAAAAEQKLADDELEATLLRIEEEFVKAGMRP